MSLFKSSSIIITGVVALLLGSAFNPGDALAKRKKPVTKKNWASPTKDHLTRRQRRKQSGQVFVFRGFNLFGSDKKLEKQRKNRVRRIRAAAPVKSKIYTYYHTPLVALADRNLKQPTSQSAPKFGSEGQQVVNLSAPGQNRLDDSLAQTIFETLKQGTSQIRVTARQRKELVQFYKARNYQPLWTDMDGVKERAKELLKTLAAAELEGLDPHDYLPPVLKSFDTDFSDIETDISALARLDLGLTAMALRYGEHAVRGRITPNRLSGYHDLSPPAINRKKTLQELATTQNPGKYLLSLQPQNRAYKALKKELAKYIGGKPEKKLPVIASGKLIKAGNEDERLPNIARHLASKGFLDKPEADFEFYLTYTDDLVAAVRAFQKANNLRADGIIGNQTIARMNGRKQLNKRRLLAYNMERLRWLPRNFGSQYIFVNQAAYKLQMFKNNRQIWQTKVVVGKPKNQTSFFIDKMEKVVFNPYWGVPQSIMKNEMLPKLQNNPGYLDRLGYEVFSSSGRRISSSSVDWWNYGGSGVLPFAVRQPPSSKNALGQIKFLFPNKHAIYMHDTPSKHLFKRKNRAFSHGCIRVYQPKIFAEKVLGWQPDRIEEQIDTGKNQTVNLQQTIPVYLTYFTAWPNENGKVEYFSDVYGRDQRLKLAFGTQKLAQNR